MQPAHTRFGDIADSWNMHSAHKKIRVSGYECANPEMLHILSRCAVPMHSKHQSTSSKRGSFSSESRHLSSCFFISKTTSKFKPSPRQSASKLIGHDFSSRYSPRSQGKGVYSHRWKLWHVCILCFFRKYEVANQMTEGSIQLLTYQNMVPMCTYAPGPRRKATPPLPISRRCIL